MPTYHYICPLCNGELDDLRSIAERDDSLGCSCGGEMRRMVTVPAVQGDPYDWSAENGGRGRLISQLQHKPGKPPAEAYCRNRQEIFDKCAKNGWTAHKV